MSIVLNGIYTIASSVKLQYLELQTICSTSDGHPVNRNEENKMQISAAFGSNLPPILNGFEVFYFKDLYSPTFLPDVNVVIDIKKMFNIMHSEWQGDPCLPEFLLWSGLNCSRSNPPRIISLSRALGNLNKKSDIYSFGIILFELMSGCSAITRSYNGSYIHLLEWVAPIIDKGKIEDVVDVRITGEVDHNSASKIVEIAMSCTQPRGDKRPDISVVLEELKVCLAMNLERSAVAESSEMSPTVMAEFDA